MQPPDLRHRGLRGNKFGLCNMTAKGRSACYQTIDAHTSRNSTWSILWIGLVYTRFRLLLLMFFFAMKAIYVIEIFPSSLSKDLNCAHSAIRRLSQRIQKARRCIFDLEKTVTRQKIIENFIIEMQTLSCLENYVEKLPSLNYLQLTQMVHYCT